MLPFIYFDNLKYLAKTFSIHINMNHNLLVFMWALIHESRYHKKCASEQHACLLFHIYLIPQTFELFPTCTTNYDAICFESMKTFVIVLNFVTHHLWHILTFQNYPPHKKASANNRIGKNSLTKRALSRIDVFFSYIKEVQENKTTYIHILFLNQLL